MRRDADGCTGRGSTWSAGGKTPLGAPMPPCGKLCLMSSGVVKRGGEHISYIIGPGKDIWAEDAWFVL